MYARTWHPSRHHGRTASRPPGAGLRGWERNPGKGVCMYVYLSQAASALTFFYGIPVQWSCLFVVGYAYVDNPSARLSKARLRSLSRPKCWQIRYSTILPAGACRSCAPTVDWLSAKSPLFTEIVDYQCVFILHKLTMLARW